MSAIGLRIIASIAFAFLLSLSSLAQSAVPGQIVAPGKIATPGQVVVPGQPILSVPGVEPLGWDSIVKELTPQPNDTNAYFSFGLTNISMGDVLINNVRTSCGCTVASLPSKPWRLAPGANGQIGATLDLRGKFGTLTKQVYVDYSLGTNTPNTTKYLTVRANLANRPAMANQMGNRERNLQIAAADRQAIFRGDCARCHVQPAVGKIGHELYQTACAICHDAPHRATMVPDLHTLKHPTDREHWIRWVTMGRAGGLMPAFAQAEGGPLTETQIDSLIDYLEKDLHKTPRPVAHPVVLQPPVLSPSIPPRVLQPLPPQPAKRSTANIPLPPLPPLPPAGGK